MNSHRQVEFPFPEFVKATKIFAIYFKSEVGGSWSMKYVLYFRCPNKVTYYSNDQLVA
jgi:hypothetical protein